MTRNASFRLNRRVFVHEWSLFIDVTLDAGCIYTRRQSRLLKFETTVRIVAIRALHRSF
jgi:hypothetical protein